MNPAHVGRTLSAYIDAGAALYDLFTGAAPDRILKSQTQRTIPPVVVELGDLLGVIYRSSKGGDAQPRAYIHFMEDPPLLTTNVQGDQLYVLGGSYRVTSRGIEG
jgi:hypothetical protein